MTVIELVREYFPNATEEECEAYLWGFTAFPFGNLKQWREQLEHLREVGPDAVEKEADLAIRSFKAACAGGDE